MIAAAHGPSSLWYATRGTGAVTLVLLSASVVLGIAETRSWRPFGTSLFAVGSLHRTLSLLALALLAVHVTTTALDPFPPISLLTAVVPFTSSYRPLWLGLGAVAADILIALVLTSLARRRLGFGAWRGVHWFAYLCWPVALLHGFGTGSDAKTTWMLVLTLCCVTAVLVALAGRLAATTTPPRVRTLASAGTAVALVAAIAWAVQGPLASGWSRRAGTPAAVLAAFGAVPPAGSRHPAQPGAGADAFGRAFSAVLRGRVTRGQSRDGTGVVDLSIHSTRGPAGRLRIRLGGRTLPDGELLMTRSAVTFGPPTESGRYRGRVRSLHHTTLQALVGSAEGRALDLSIQLSLNGNAVSGTLRGVPVRAVRQ
jgi:hypothetical protein